MNRPPLLWWLPCTALVLTPADGPGRAQAADAQPPVVLSACEHDYPPFCIVRPDGRVDGFSVELLRAALQAMGRDVSFRTGSWAEVKGWLERGEIQALPLVGRTPEREATFDFTVPYLTMHGAIVVRRDTTGIAELHDLRGRRVAVMQGDNTEEFLRREDRGLDILTTPTFAEALQALSQRRCEAVVVQRLVALRLLAEHRLASLRIVDRPIEGFSQTFCFAVREGDRDTLALLNEGLALTVADGTHRRLHVKWFASLELPSDRPLVFGGDHNCPPFEFLDEKGRPAGFTVELTQAIARELGLEIRIRLGPWTEIRKGLEDGDIDAIQRMVRTDAREQRLAFTPPYLPVNYVSVVRRDRTPPPETLAALAGRSLVVQDGDAILELVDRQGLRRQTTTVQTQADALRAVAEGNQDCALVVRLSALHLIQQHGWTNLALGTRSFLAGEYGYAVNRSRPALVAELAEGLQVLQHSGQYRAIHQKWLGVYDPGRAAWQTVLTYVAAVALPLLVVALLALAWSWSLRQQVAHRTAELASHYRLLSVAGETARFGGWKFDLAASQLTWSDLVADIHEVPRGYAPTVEEGIGFYAPEWRPAITQAFTACARDGTPYDEELEILTARGRRVWVRTTGEAVRDPAGTITRVQGAFQDITERKHAEAALIASERKWRDVLVNVPQIGIALDPRARIVFANDHFLRLTGWKPEEVLEQDWFDRFIPPDLQEEMRGVFQTVMADRHTETFHSYENDIVTRHGDRRRVAWSNVLTRNVHGDVVDVTCLGVDLTERARAEASLRQSEAQFRTLVEQSPAAIFIQTYAHFAYANPAALRLFGCDRPEELLGQPVLEWVHPDHREPVRERTRRVQERREPAPPSEETYLRRDGAPVLVEASAVPFAYQGASGALVFAHDVTERKRIEEQVRAAHLETARLLTQSQQARRALLSVVEDLRQSEEQFRAMFEVASIGMAQADVHTGQWLRVNRKLCALTGYSPDEMLRLKSPDLTCPEDRAHAWEILQRVVRGDAPDGHLETRYVRKDGQVVWASINLTVTRNAAGTPLRTLEAIEDITERKRLEHERQLMEAQLRQQQKLESIGTLASGVAHEINNPITGIMNYAQLIQDRLPPDSPLSEFTAEIMHETQRVAGIVRDLLTFARNEKQCHSPARIADIIEGTLSLIRTVIRHDSITLTVNVPADLPPLKCRSQQIQQVVMNLMTNARDALNERFPNHDPDKVLQLEARLVEKTGRSWIRVTVEDHGPGIPPEVRERMFDPFFTTKARDKGTGLGLAISHGIVKEHEGEMTVETELGRFTRFHVDLPVDNGWNV